VVDQYLIQIENSLSEDWFKELQVDIFIEKISVSKHRTKGHPVVLEYPVLQDPEYLRATHRHFFLRAKLITRLIDAARVRNDVARALHLQTQTADLSDRRTKSNTQLDSSSFPIVLTSE